MDDTRRDLIPIASALNDLWAFPEDVKDVMGKRSSTRSMATNIPLPNHCTVSAARAYGKSLMTTTERRIEQSIPCDCEVAFTCCTHFRKRRGAVSSTDQHDIELIKRRLNAAIKEDARRTKEGSLA